VKHNGLVWIIGGAILLLSFAKSNQGIPSPNPNVVPDTALGSLVVPGSLGPGGFPLDPGSFPSVGALYGAVGQAGTTVGCNNSFVSMSGCP
jgi:hypothetical protein